MRLFIAINLPESVQNHLSELQQHFAGIGKITFAKESHLTLKFLGEVSPMVAKQVQDALARVKFKSFKLQLLAAGVFPDENLPRVLWVGITPEDDVIKLQEQIDFVLERFFPAEKNFIPHLTLGRIKLVSDKVWFADRVSKTKVKPISFEVNSFALVQSELSSKGPKYTTLKEYSA